jgi:hypothetical protein
LSKFAKASSDLEKVKELVKDEELLESIQVAQQAISIIELMSILTTQFKEIPPAKAGSVMKAK